MADSAVFPEGCAEDIDSVGGSQYSRECSSGLQSDMSTRTDKRSQPELCREALSYQTESWVRSRNQAPERKSEICRAEAKKAKPVGWQIHEGEMI